MASLQKLSILVSSILLLLFISLQGIHAELKESDLLSRFCQRRTSYHACIDSYSSNPQIKAAAETNNSVIFALAIMKNWLLPQTIATHNILVTKKQNNATFYAACESDWAKLIPISQKFYNLFTQNKGYRDQSQDGFDFTTQCRGLIDHCGTDLIKKGVLVDLDVSKGEGIVRESINAVDTLFGSVFSIDHHN